MSSHDYAEHHSYDDDSYDADYCVRHRNARNVEQYDVPRRDEQGRSRLELLNAADQEADPR